MIGGDKGCWTRVGTELMSVCLGKPDHKAGRVAPVPAFKPYFVPNKIPVGDVMGYTSGTLVNPLQRFNPGGSSLTLDKGSQVANLKVLL